MQPLERHATNGTRPGRRRVEVIGDRGTDLHDIRKANRLLIFNYIREHKTVPRADLARYTGLSRTTIGNIVDELVKEGAISEGESGISDDRRTIPLTFNATAGYVLGCSLGRNHLTVLLTDLTATTLQRADIPFPTNEGPQAGLSHLATELQAFVAQQHIPWHKVIGIGLGIVGPLDSSLRRTTVPTTLSGWGGTDIKQALEEALHLPVYLDNNGNMGALGESRYGAGRGIRNMLYVKIGSGIAGGLIINGQLYRGSSGSAGEIGHIPIEYNGTLCHCGHFGCLETVAGTRGILTEAQRLSPEIASMTQLIAAAREGNAACIHALERAGNYLGFTLASLVNIFNPALIVLDGSTMRADDLLLRPLHTMLEAHCLQAPFANVEIVPAECSGIAIALGGVAAVLDDAFSTHTA